MTIFGLPIAFIGIPPSTSQLFGIGYLRVLEISKKQNRITTKTIICTEKKVQTIKPYRLES